MEELQINYIVVFKAKPNSGEMIVVEIHEKYQNFPFRSKFDAVIKVQFWVEEEKDYKFSTFYRSQLELKSS